MHINNSLRKTKSLWLSVFTLILAFNFIGIYSCDEGNDPSSALLEEVDEIEEVEARDTLELNLRIHLMKDINMTHPTGIEMSQWVTRSNLEETVIPELNAIWSQSDVVWKMESIIQEDVVKGIGYNQAIDFLANTARDSEGQGDPARLSLLYDMMQPEHRSTTEELGKNLFHIYIFPFIGNTSQGHAMTNFGSHCVVSCWSNKHNGGGVPEKTLLKEHQNVFSRGSLSRTIAHELGHVLDLNHNECDSECLMGGNFSNGYFLTDVQISTARAIAIVRSQ